MQTTAALGPLLIAVPKLLPAGGPWVQLALGAITLILAFRARAIGMRGIAGQVAFGVLTSFGS